MQTPQIKTASVKLEEIESYVDAFLNKCEQLRRGGKKELSEGMEAKEDFAFMIRHILKTI